MIFKRYGAGILATLIAVVTAFVAIPASVYTPEIIIGLAVVGLQAFGVFLLPLVDGPWRGALKTGSAVLLAVLYAVVSFLTGDHTLDPAQVGVVVLAALNALASELGVAVRTDPKVGVVTVPVGGFTTQTQPTPGHPVLWEESDGRHEA